MQEGDVQALPLACMHNCLHRTGQTAPPLNAPRWLPHPQQPTAACAPAAPPSHQRLAQPAPPLNQMGCLQWLQSGAAEQWLRLLLCAELRLCCVGCFHHLITSTASSSCLLLAAPCPAAADSPPTSISAGSPAAATCVAGAGSCCRNRQGTKSSVLSPKSLGAPPAAAAAAALLLLPPPLLLLPPPLLLPLKTANHVDAGPAAATAVAAAWLYQHLGPQFAAAALSAEPAMPPRPRQDVGAIIKCCAWRCTLRGGHPAVTATM